MINRKEAIQKTIMSMTLGKDVSALFPDVLKNIATADLDQKKLVYLYLMWVFTLSIKCLRV
jgi:vesicle coat complex subunit